MVGKERSFLNRLRDSTNHLIIFRHHTGPPQTDHDGPVSLFHHCRAPLIQSNQADSLQDTDNHHCQMASLRGEPQKKILAQAIQTVKFLPSPLTRNAQHSHSGAQAQFGKFFLLFILPKLNRLVAVGNYFHR